MLQEQEGPVASRLRPGHWWFRVQLSRLSPVIDNKEPRRAIAGLVRPVHRHALDQRPEAARPHLVDRPLRARRLTPARTFGTPASRASPAQASSSAAKRSSAPESPLVLRRIWRNSSLRRLRSPGPNGRRQSLRAGCLDPTAKPCRRARVPPPCGFRRRRSRPG